MTMSDCIEQRISGSASDCERVYGALSPSSSATGETATNLAELTKVPRIRVIDALEQMERRGAVRHEMTHWFALPVGHSAKVGT